MSKYKITYFDGQGRAEVPRLLMVIGGLDFEDVRLKREEWQELKPKTPFGALPILEVEGQTLCQGNAIAGFIARRIGRGGETDLEQARAHMIADCIDDVFKPFYKTFATKDEEEKKKLRENFCENELPPFFEKFEKMLNASATGHFLGTKLTWPDIALYQMINGLQLFDYMTDCSDKYPKITELVKKVKTEEKLAKWISQRPKTSF